MPLSDLQIRNLKPADKARKHSDGGGLHVVVTPKGSKLWRMAYRFGGAQKLLSFGPYPDVTLVEARTKRSEAKALLARSIDPGDHLKREKEKAELLAATTFRKVAEEVIAKGEREGRAKSTIDKRRWILDLVDNDIGNRPIDQLTAQDVLVPLRKIEAKGHYETARRMRSTIGLVFRYAIATGRAENDPTFGLRGALVAPKVKHRAAFTDWDRFGGLLRMIWKYEGASETRLGLQLLALLYPRPGELRQAEWTEFDLEKRIWTIPASRSKTRKEHRKPLSKLTVDILRDLQARTGHGRLVFPAIHTPLRPMSENTLNTALRRMGFGKDEMTSHGFRATASSLLNESGLWNADAIEAELAHVGADEVRRAYHRAAYWDERVRMAEWWANRIFEAVSLTDA